MDDVSKFLQKLTKSEREKIIALIRKLIQGDLERLDIKKLRGFEGVFRARAGRIRIIYRVLASGVEILQVGFRSEDTYR